MPILSPVLLKVEERDDLTCAEHMPDSRSRLLPHGGECMWNYVILADLRVSIPVWT